jgi:uncharacterized membrane protein YebE (DUF533 family)
MEVQVGKGPKMDIKRLLDGFLGQDGSGQNAGAQIKDMISGGPSGKLPGGTAGLGGMPGGLAGGAAAGGLIALLMGSKKARKIGGKALTYGGLAVVGGLAYKAWSDYRANQQGGVVPMSQLPAPPAGSPFDLSGEQGEQIRLSLVRAMISAANADGHIDQGEHAKIQQQIQAMELAADEKAFLFDQLSAPSDPIAIARLSQGDEHAAEIYLASALAVDVDTPEELRYLERLSDALHLPAALRTELDRHASAAKQST